MNTCLSFLNFDNSLRSLIKTFRENKETIHQLLPKVQKLLNDYKEYSQPEELISRVVSLLNRLDNSLNLDNNTIQKWINGETDSVNPTISTTSSIDKTLSSRKSFRRGFLDKIYKDADVIKNQVESKVRFDLANILLWNKEKHQITNPKQLNENIKDYQEELFNVIKTYIDNNKYIKNKIEGDLYNEDYSYTGTFEKNIQILIDLFYDIKPEILLSNYLSNNEANKRFLEAFNAFQILLHFDEFVLNTFGDNITIQNIRTRFTTEEKYSLKNKSKEMVWSNQKDDDIKVEDSINDISKVAITTTRMYDHRTGKIMDNNYLSTNEFIAVINQIKDLYWNTEINKTPITDGAYINENLSEATKEYIQKLRRNYEDVVFSELLITQLPGRHIRNIEGWAAILDVIINTPDIFNTFNLLEKNIIYSIRQELLDNRASNENKSLFSIKTRDNFILNTLAQTIEGIWPVKNCSIKEKEEGVSLQQLQTSEVGRLQFLLNNDINQINHFAVFSAKKFDVKKSPTEFTWSIKLPLNEKQHFIIKIKNGKNGYFKLLDSKRNPVKKEDLALHETALLKFIDSVLYQNFSTNKDYFDYFKYVNNTSNSSNNNVITSLALESLVKLASGILVNAQLSYNTQIQYESDKQDPNKQKNLLGRYDYFEKAYKTEYGDDIKVEMDFALQTFDLIPKQQIATIEQLAMAKAILKGVSVARQVNDSEGNAISTATPSRLSSNLERQLIAFKQDENAPCHNFLFVQEANLCQGLFSTRDYVTKDGDSKKYIEFSTREFLEDSFINSFLVPLLATEESNYNLLGEDTIAIIPAVYSDKNTVTKMVINLKPLIEKLEDKNIENTKDLLKSKKAIPLLREYISRQLYDYYNKLIIKINKDLTLLSESKIFKKINFAGPLNYSARSYSDLQKAVNAYNKNNPTNPLSVSEVFDIASKETGVKVNEELHIVRVDSSITVNNTLIDLHERYGEIVNNNSTSKTDTFWKNKNAEVFQYMLNNKVDVDLYTNPKIRDFFESKELSNWVGKDGKLILGVITIPDGKGGTIKLPISNKVDFQIIKNYLIPQQDLIVKKLQQQYNSANSIEQQTIKIALEKETEILDNIKNLEYNIHELFKYGSLELNPVLEQFNMIHYLFSQEYILSTVGSHVNHPIKKGKIAVNKEGRYLDDKGNPFMTVFDYIKEESERTNAQNKRNVAHTAAVHPFQLNLKYGITEDYKITILEDINDLMYNALGDNARLKPFDGATYVDPYTVHLENHSLQGEAAGIHKKQFIHFYDDETGTGGIIKTAGFGITNYWIRNSPFIQRLNKKMTNEPWKNKDGSVVYLDITRKVQNADLKNNALRHTAFYKDFDANGNEIYFKLENISYLNNGNYHLIWKQVRKDGSLISDGRIIDEFTGKMPLGFQSENEIRENIAKEGESDGVIDSTYKVYQYIFKGIKCVALDPNSKELSDKGDCGESSILNTLKVINECGYIKDPNNLNNQNQDNFYQPAKHSLINYAPTAGAIKQGAANFNSKARYYDANGLSYYKIKMTNAGIQLDKEHHADDSEISMMTQVVSACAALGHNWDESNKLYQALYNLTEQGIESLLGDLSDTLTQNSALSKESKEKLHKVLTTIIIKSLATGSKAKDGIAFSITQELIDKYLNGEVLTDEDFKKCPLSISDPNIFNKTQSQISSILNKFSIKLKFKGILSVLIPSHEIMKIYGGKLKGSYKNFDTEIKLLQEAMPSNLKTTDLMCGRTYYQINKATKEKKLIHIQSPFMSEKEKGDVYGNPNLIYTSYYELNNALDKDNYEYQEYIVEGRNLAPYHCTFKVGDQTYSFYDLKVVKEAFKTSTKSPELRKEVQDELVRLSKGGPITLVDGRTITIDTNSLEVFPAEVIMPKTVASLYGLTVEDSLDKIENDPEFFTKRLQQNLSLSNPDRNSYTVALKNINGKHVYILDRETYNKRKHQFTKSTLPEIENDPISGDITRIDENGNEIYKLSSITDEICLTHTGHEVIVTDNVEFYINNLQYNTLYVSNQDKFKEIYNLDSDNKAFNSWKKQLGYEYSKAINLSKNLEKEDLGDRAKVNLNTLFDLNENFHKNPNSGYLQTLGHEMHTSFLKYLEIIAARIPAQSMQSFMPMKIVGFDESGHNNAFVCTQQIWLQGSDFDIDCVSLLTYEFDRSGKFVGWSPFFNLTNTEQLRLSTDLNFPTGKDITILDRSYFANQSKNSTKLIEHFQDVINAFTTHSKENNKEVFKIAEPQLTKEIVTALNLLLNTGILDLSSLTEGDYNKILKRLNLTYNTTFTKEFLEDLFKHATQALNKHNNYIKTSPHKEAFTKNYVVEQMIRIAKNPANLSQAHVSVDETVSVAKNIAKQSKLEKLGNYVGHGNIGALLKAIEDNHVGKDVIGITAVGLKAFFALTQYTNTVLNTDPKARQRLLKPITFQGKEYSIIANANPKNMETNKAILDAIAISSERDAALLISALLSLATDNAKELCLAKLNANADMAGMYIYGLTMGISFDQLGKLLMSDLGNTVADLLKGSIITDKLNLYNIDKVLDYIHTPVKILKKSLNNSTYVKVIGNTSKKIKAWNTYEQVLFPSKQNQMGGGLPFFTSNLLKSMWSQYEASLNKNIAFNAYTFFNFIEYVVKLKHEGSIQAQESLLELINELRAFNLDNSKIIESKRENKTVKNNKTTPAHPKIYECHNMLLEALLMEYNIPLNGYLNDFITLHKGADRMQRLGALLGANQGIKNPIEDYLNFIFKFEELGVNFDEFMDSEDIRNEAIQNEINGDDPVNILDIVTTVDHYWGYIKTIHKKHQLLMNTSKRYRTLYKYLRDIPASGPLNKKIQALNKLISYKMNNDYFIDSDISITVPGGTPLYFITNNGTYQSTTSTTTENIKVKLGTQGGNAVFKNIVDSIIIPALQEGKNSNFDTPVIANIKNNKFIQSLRPNVFDKNPSKNASLSWSTDVDMSPVNDRGQAVLANLRQEFDLLSQDFILKDDVGNEIFKMPIKEIFFIYNLITYNGVSGQNTFTKVLDNYITKFTEKYRSVLMEYDLSGVTFEISESELAAWTAQIGSPFASWSEYIYEKDKASMTYQLKIKQKSEDGDYYAQISSSNIDKNVILHTPTSLDSTDSIKEFTVDDQEGSFRCYFNTAYGMNVLENKNTGEVFIMPGIEIDQLITSKNDKVKVNTKLLTNLIKKAKNC